MFLIDDYVTRTILSVRDELYREVKDIETGYHDMQYTQPSNNKQTSILEEKFTGVSSTDEEADEVKRLLSDSDTFSDDWSLVLVVFSLCDEEDDSSFSSPIMWNL
jgi:hypothetical protein